MSIFLAILGFFKELFGFAKEKERSDQLDQARQGGAAEARDKGSNEVDDIVDRARLAQENLEDDEEAIANDPNNRAKKSRTLQCFVALLLPLIVIACANGPINSATTGQVFKRVCHIWKKGDYSYVKGKPEISDTRPTIDFIRDQNAGRATVCDPPAPPKGDNQE